MITQRTYINIFKIIIFLIIVYILYFFISVCLSKSKLISKENHGEFKLSSLLTIKENRIEYESLLYKEDKFFGARGVIDSFYYFSIIKIGKVDNKDLNDIIKFRTTEIPRRNKWFNYDIISPDPTSINVNFNPFFNIYVLPLANKVDFIEIYVNGKVLTHYFNNNYIEYQFNSSNIDLTFNNLDKNDFGYIGFKELSSIVFIKDQLNLYIMNISPIVDIGEGTYMLKVPYKGLKEILQE